MRSKLLSVIAVLVSATACQGAAAENLTETYSPEALPMTGYLSIYGGWVATSSGTIQGSVLESINPMVIVDFDKSYDENSTGAAGLRLGIWVDEGRYRNWGLAFDTWYYKVSPSSEVEFGVVPVSLMGMYRLRLLDGKVEPYVGVGGLISFVDVDVQAEFPDGSIRNLSGNLSDGGWDACVGCSLSITEKSSVFIEYRYVDIHASMNNSDTDSGNFGAFDADLSSHQILAGLTLKLR